MMLLVDIGNTRVKWATCQAGRLSPNSAAAHAQWTLRSGASSSLRRRPINACRGGVRRGRRRVASYLEQAAARCGATVQFVATSAQPPA